MLIVICFSAVPVTLVVPEAEFFITEGDINVSMNVSVMVTSTLTQPQLRPILFELVLSDLTTASPEEYSLTNSFVIIPANTVGTFSTSITITLIGDNIIEANETIVYYLRPRTVGDMVNFTLPDGSNAITINIIDNDGKSSDVSAHIIIAMVIIVS